MNELILIKTDNSGKQAVSARELHEFLEVGRDFTTWCKQMFEYGFVENIDYSEVYPESGENYEKRGRPKIDYVLSLSCAKEISMLQRSERGRAARKYFIDCEERLKNQSPQDYLSALKAYVASEEKRLLAEAELKQAKPKVELHDSVILSENYFSFKEVCDLFGFREIGRNKFMAILKDDEILSKQNKPYVYYVNKGYFKADLIDNNFVYQDGTIDAIYNTKVSISGIDFLFKKYKSLITDKKEVEKAIKRLKKNIND